MKEKIKKNKIILKAGIVLLISSFFVSAGWAKIIYVNIEGGADYTKIQDAINAANYGDTVQVASGAYVENVDMKEGVNLAGTGAGVTIIKSPAAGVSLSGVVWGAPDTVLQGFTVAGDNTWGISGYNRDTTTMIIRNNVIKNHYVGIAYTEALIINNVISDNRHSGIGLGNPIIKNNIFTGNGYGYYGGIYMRNTINSANGFRASGWSISYNDLWNNNPNYSYDASCGTGDISLDPLFVDAWSGDYHLRSNSPCIDAGDPSILDEDGSCSDMGVYGGGFSKPLPPDCGFQGVAYERNLDGSIGDKLPGVNITFTSEDGKVTKNITTNTNGYYKVKLMPARYVVAADCPNYEDYSSSPGFFVCTGDGYQTGNFFLKKIVKDSEPPQVNISITPQEVKPGESISVTVLGTDDLDLSAIWWWGENTGDEELDKAHWYSCSGTSVTHTWTFDTISLSPGTYTLGANARDAAYPVAGEAHQASEGDGIAYACFTILDDVLISTGPTEVSGIIEGTSTVTGIDDNVALEISSAAIEVLEPILSVEPVLLDETSINFEDTDFYRVYWDRGEGKIDYSEPVATIEKSGIVWKKELLIEENTAYQFVVKAVDINGNEENVRDPVSIVIINNNEENIVSSSRDLMEVIIPEDAVEEDNPAPELEQETDIVLKQEKTLILEIIEEPLDIPPAPEELRPVNEYRSIQITIDGNEAVLKKEITIIIPYGDNDHDGFVDGTDIPETRLVILWYNPQSRKWERDFLTYVDVDKNTCTAHTKRQGKFAIFSPVNFMPHPVSNLSGKVDGKKARLDWNASHSASWGTFNIYIKGGIYYEKDYQVHYNIYFDGGTGEIDYSKPIAEVAHSELAWTLHQLSPGTYRFALRVEDIEGNEEKNNTFVEIEISYSEVEVNSEGDSEGKAKAYIKVPKAGKRIRGNAVTVIAEADDQTAGVLFQYMKSGEGQEWTDISTLDKKKPYAVYWNVSGLENGEYLLRAVAYDNKNSTDIDPPSIKVIVDDVNWDIQEDGNPEVDPNKEHRKCEKIDTDKDSEVVIADGTSATIPAGVIPDDEVILDITILAPEKMEKYHPPAESSIKPIGVFRKFEFRNGIKLFNKNITISIPYMDEDSDEIVDGTDIKAEDLRIFYLKEDSEEWIEISDSKKGKVKAASIHKVSNSENIVTARVNHFTIFALMAYTPAADLSDVIVYPNPFKPNSGLGHEAVTFDGLTEDVKIRVFTIAGRLVREWEGNTVPDYQWEWDVKNNDNNDVVSGVYIYVITSDGEEMKKGKIAVIK